MYLSMYIIHRDIECAYIYIDTYMFFIYTDM